MRNKNNGFTLVELLVTIVILGIITGISIPLIRNVQISQRKKQYETYRNSLSYASKVYADSFSEDLFGHDEIACATVTYNQLKSKNLIKDVPISGVSCASSDTFVRIVKFEDQYSYLPKITCGVPQTGGAISKDVEIPEGNVDSSLCGLNVDTKIDIKFSPESSHTPNVQRKNITVEFKSPTGIHSDPIIYWAFSDKADFSSIIGEWKQLDIDIPSKKKQKAQILQGSTISLTKEFITPKNYSGKLYLVLKIDRLQDLGGKNWTNTDTEVVSGGYYAVDNEPPLLNDSEIKYSKPVHRQVTPTLNFKATDNLTSESNLRMCISEDTATDTCSKNINNIKKKHNGWVSYNKSKVLPVINNASNGKNHNIFISIGDQAGNYVTQQFIYYQFPSDYSITYNLDGGTHGSSHPEVVDFGEEFTVSHPTKTVTLTFVNDVGATIDYSSSTVSKSGEQVPYTFSGWNISGMDTSTHVIGSGTSNNIEESNVLETKFKHLRETSNGVLFDATWSSPHIVLPKVTKTASKCMWTSTGNYEWESGGTYTPSSSAGATARTFTASCSPNTYTISYNYNGGTAPSSGVPNSYIYGTGGTINGKPTRTSYTFNGWSFNSNLSSPAFSKTISKTDTGNKNLYAKWCENCSSVSNGSCTLDAATAGTCSYSTSCNSGYYISSGASTKKPVCKEKVWEISSPKGFATTLQEALDKADSGATLKLLKNDEDDNTSRTNTKKSSVTINLNGKKLTMKYQIKIISGNSVTISGGTLSSPTTGIFVVNGHLTMSSGTIITTGTECHAVAVGDKNNVGKASFRMTGGTLKTSTVVGHSTLLVEYGASAVIENSVITNTNSNEGGAVTIHDANKVYFKSGANISVSKGQAVFIGNDSNINNVYVFALAGSSITGKTNSIGITRGYICLSDKTTLKGGSSTTGRDSIYVGPNAHMMGVDEGLCKTNL